MSCMRRVCVGAARLGGVAAAADVVRGSTSLPQTGATLAHHVCSPPVQTPRRTLSSMSGGGVGGKEGGHDNAGFLQRLKDLYREFQLSQDRKLDAVAAEEAQEGRDRFFDDARRLDPRHPSSSDTSAGRGDSPLISRNPNLCPRSVLFVPGSKPRAMEKIASLSADCYILDLEDSVGVASKRQARETIRDFVEGLQRRRRLRRDAQVAGSVNSLLHGHAKTGASSTGADGAKGSSAGLAEKESDDRGFYPRLIVRINSPDFDPATAMLDLELVGLLGPAIEGIALPKTTQRTYALIKDYIHPDHQLWAFFEAPKSIMEASAICKQQVYQYAVMGYNDLSLELQLPMSATLSTTEDSVSEAVKESLYVAAHLPLWQCTAQVLQAARAYNMFVLDAVFNDPTDKAGFRRSLQECKLLGLNGKTLIHPSQIEPTNAVYTPTETDVAWAIRIIEAMEKAQGGVATVDGKMVEELHKRQADRVLALHRSTEAETKRRAMEKAQAEEAGEASGDSGAAEGNREARRTPSRHRPLH